MANDERELFEALKAKGALASPAIADAFEKIDRADFVPDYLQRLAYEDRALPIGAGQTISQPYTVGFMLEQLDVRPGQTILDAGSGSGWQAALLAHLAGSKGVVCAMEVVPEMCEHGKKNLETYPELSPRVRFFCRSAADGCVEGEPFDRIIAAAEVAAVPEAWRAQLAENGRMIYPQGEMLVLETKTAAGFERREFPGFVFVPFLNK